jgi:hypothetical protein
MDGMSMRREIVLAAIFVALMGSVSRAGDVVCPTSLIVFAYSDRPSVSVSLRKAADFVAMPISIRCDHKEPSKRFEIIAQAKAAIMKAAEGKKNIRVHSGPVALSARPTGKLDIPSSSGGYGGTSQAQVHVLVALADTGKDVFHCAAEISEFIEGVHLPEKAWMEYGQIHLAVDNPEQYREALLKAISAETTKSKAVLGSSGQVVLSGLESPVHVRQADESHVDLFLGYSVSLTVRE